MNDLKRILSIPRKAPEGEIRDFTPIFKREGGAMRLRDIQNIILGEAGKAGGLLGIVGVGEGKTLASFLIPHLFNSSRPLLLLPAALRAQAQADWITYGAHFHLPQNYNMRSYEELSTQPGLLRGLMPDLIVCDEVHKLKSLTSARTRRVKKYLSYCVRSGRDLPKFVGLSGSITSTSIHDYWHLCLWALVEKSPLPTKWSLLEAWASVLDEGRGGKRADLTTLRPLMELFGTSSPREAFMRNLTSSLGVVVSRKPSPPCKLKITKLKTQPDKKVGRLIAALNKTWCFNGEELPSALHVTRVRRQLICGFGYFWDWPSEPDREWLEKRSAWAKATRIFSARAPEGLDTPALIERAVIQFLNRELDIKLPRELVMSYIGWHGVKDRPLPPIGVRWYSDYFLRLVVNWVAKQTEPPLVWYEHRALAIALAKLTGWPVYGPGDDELLTSISHPHVALISIRAHSAGKNLQAWGNHFIAHPLSDGARYEQLLGRSHRTGQSRASVTVAIPSWGEFEFALNSAKEKAQYIRESTGLEQRLLKAEWSEELTVQLPLKSSKD